jgi:hypothetical protein
VSKLRSPLRLHRAHPRIHWKLVHSSPNTNTNMFSLISFFDFCYPSQTKCKTPHGVQEISSPKAGPLARLRLRPVAAQPLRGTVTGNHVSSSSRCGIYRTYAEASNRVCGLSAREFGTYLEKRVRPMNYAPGHSRGSETDSKKSYLIIASDEVCVRAIVMAKVDCAG